MNFGFPEENSFEDRTGLPKTPKTPKTPIYLQKPVPRLTGVYTITGGVTVRQWMRQIVCLFRGHISLPVYHGKTCMFTQCCRCHRIK
jgi:hypothetical protein